MVKNWNNSKSIIYLYSIGLVRNLIINEFVAVLRFHSTWCKTYENASVCFCPKMPCTNIHCLTPSHPPKCAVDIKWEESEYVNAPLSDQRCWITDPDLMIWIIPKERAVPYDIFATLCRAVHWKYEKYLCTIGRVRRVSFFLLDSTGVLKKLCCGGYKKIILILKISTSIHNECRGTYFTLGLPFTCEIRLSEYKTDDQSNQAYQKNVYIHRLTNDFPVHNRFYRLLMQNRRSTINLSIEKLPRIWWLVSIAVKFSK